MQRFRASQEAHERVMAAQRPSTAITSPRLAPPGPVWAAGALGVIASLFFALMSRPAPELAPVRK